MRKLSSRSAVLLRCNTRRSVGGQLGQSSAPLPVRGDPESPSGIDRARGWVSSPDAYTLVTANSCQSPGTPLS